MSTTEARAGTILVIEDDARIRQVMRTILMLQKIDVVFAETGRDGLDLLQQQEFDLVLCDINLPDMQGYDILHIVKNNVKTYRIPFIFLTAFADHADVRKGMNDGADDYITKPFSAASLVSAITSRLKIKEREAGMDARQVADKWLTLLNHNFTHECLTPLNGIVNIAKLMEESHEVPDMEYFRELVNGLHISANRMLRNTRKLMMFSIIHASKLQIHPRTISANLGDIVFGLIQTRIMTDARILIDAEVQAVKTWRGHADYTVMILEELLDNALRFSAGAADVRLSLIPAPDGGFEFRISNTVAQGIAPDLEAVDAFKKFHEDISLNGLGIGLYISKELSRQLGYTLGLQQSGNEITFVLRA